MQQSLQAMNSLIEGHPVITHPFLVRFSQGGLTTEQIKRWARQQFYLSHSFPDTLATLFSRIPFTHVQEKRALLEMLYREARGGNDPDSHEAQFTKMALFLRVNPTALLSEEPTSYTQQFISQRQRICETRSVAEGLAAMAVANEILNLSIFKAYQEGVQKMAGLEACPTDYFAVHLRDEYEDFSIMNEAFKKVSSEISVEKIEQAILDLLDVRMTYFDSLWNDLGLNV